MPGQYLLNIGFGNFVLASRVVAIVNPSSSPMRRLREDAKMKDGWWTPPKGAKPVLYW